MNENNIPYWWTFRNMLISKMSKKKKKRTTRLAIPVSSQSSSSQSLRSTFDISIRFQNALNSYANFDLENYEFFCVQSRRHTSIGDLNHINFLEIRYYWNIMRSDYSTVWFLLWTASLINAIIAKRLFNATPNKFL